MLIQGQVGPVTGQSIAPGATPVVRLGQLGDVVASELHGRYYETTFRKSMYMAALTVATSVTAGIATSYQGFIISNPFTSTINVVVNKIGLLMAGSAATNAASVGIQTGFSPTLFSTLANLTAITPRGGFVGQPLGQCLAYYTTGSNTTLPSTPTVHSILATYGTQAITSSATILPTFVDMEGSLILPPGGYMALFSSATQTSQFWASYQWEEVPV